MAALCADLGVDCFRGSLEDVLSRFVGAVEAFGGADHIVRLTADCPLADWTVIDACVALHEAKGADCTTNAVRRTFPDGLDVEIVTTAVLSAISAEAVESEDREHVTPFIYAAPHRFLIEHLTQERDLAALRWTVDYADDLEFVRSVFEQLYPDKPSFETADVLALPIAWRVAGLAES